ncbi:Serine hydrolase-like protein, partial [Fragariocoptes setiger]
MGRRAVIEEREFEVPYGLIRAKTWHEDTDDCVKILALHGWMDNAGSFDRLIPHLNHPRGIYVVAMDLPGHGRSSQLPKGSIYGDTTFIVEIRRVVMQLGWKRFYIMGHSLGGGLALWYASLYPDEVEQLILLDFIKPRTTTTEDLAKRTSDAIDHLIEITKRGTRDKGTVTVSRETAIITTIEAHKSLGVLSRDDATCLLKRSTIDVSVPPNSVIYYRDLRLQSMINYREHLELARLMFDGVKCEIITLLGKDGFYKSEAPDDYWIYLDEFMNILASRCAKFSVYWLEKSDHYLHMNKASEVAPYVNKFMENPESNYFPQLHENLPKCLKESIQIKNNDGRNENSSLKERACA